LSEQLVRQRSQWPEPAAPLPEAMHAVAFEEFGGPEVLQLTLLPTPRPGAGEVVVRVAAVSIGRLLDLTARAGTHPYARFTLPHVLGAEHSGTVAAVGAGVDTVSVGDRVAVFPVLSCGHCPACTEGAIEACPEARIMGVHLQGAYAQYTVVPVQNVFRVPAAMDPVTSAALALAGPVAQNQFDQAGLKPGEWVLVQGAASALGSLTVALAVHHGAQVIATSRSASKRAALHSLGPAAVLDPLDPGFAAEVSRLTGGSGVALAVDDLGHPDIWRSTMDVLGARGRVVCSGAFLGGRVELDLLRLYSRSQRVIGVRSGNLSSARRLWDAAADGFRPPVDRTFPITDAAAAHRYLEADTNTGRVILTTADDDWPAAPDLAPNSVKA
jgi:NADPH:quinone reductase-like Zn-dependent oxidoreductase